MRALILALLVSGTVHAAPVDSDDRVKFADAVGSDVSHALYGHTTNGAGARHVFNTKSVLIGLTDNNVVAVTRIRKKPVVSIPYTAINDLQVEYSGKSGADILVVHGENIRRFDIHLSDGGAEFLDALRNRTK